MTGWLRRKSFRVRLGALVAAAVGVAVALTALASYFAVRHQLYSQVDSSLNERDGRSPAVIAAPGLRSNHRAPGSSATTTTACSRSSARTRASIYPDPSVGPALPVSPADANLAANGGSSIRTITYRGQPYRVITQGGTLGSTSAPPWPSRSPVR